MLGPRSPRRRSPLRPRAPGWPGLHRGLLLLALWAGPALAAPQAQAPRPAAPDATEVNNAPDTAAPDTAAADIPESVDSASRLAVTGDPAQAPATESTTATKPDEAAPATGWAFQGLPLANFNTDTGFGYGAQVVAVDRADGTWRPWRASIMLRYWATTRNIYGHILAIDLPRFLGSRWRFGLELQASRNLYNPWYGLGNDPGYQDAWSSCGDRDALASNPDVCPGNPAFRGLRYASYELTALPRILLNLRYPLSEHWSLFLGHRLRLERIRLGYSAEELGQTGTSLLAEDALAGRVTGLDGSVRGPQSQRTSELTAGIQYDTRDPEAAPTRGVFHELAARAGHRLLGSEFDYWGLTLHARGWFPLPGTDRRVVVALRGLADVLGGQVPVSLMPFFGGLESKEGVGGTASVRGVLRNRYQGPVKLLGNAELHWMPLTVHPFSQRIDLGVIGFVDAGRVWSDLRLSDGGGITASTGGGLRLVWNRVMVVRADYGVGLTEPTQGFYLEMGHAF